MSGNVITCSLFTLGAMHFIIGELNDKKRAINNGPGQLDRSQAISIFIIGDISATFTRQLIDFSLSPVTTIPTIVSYACSPASEAFENSLSRTQPNAARSRDGQTSLQFIAHSMADLAQYVVVAGTYSLLCPDSDSINSTLLSPITAAKQAASDAVSDALPSIVLTSLCILYGAIATCPRSEGIKMIVIGLLAVTMQSASDITRTVTIAAITELPKTREALESTLPAVAGSMATAIVCSTVMHRSIQIGPRTALSEICSITETPRAALAGVFSVSVNIVKPPKRLVYGLFAALGGFARDAKLEPKREAVFDYEPRDVLQNSAVVGAPSRNL
jgi:hypothetical protein